MAEEPKSDFVKDALSEAAGLAQPNSDGILPVMAIGRRASSSAEITARARALEANPLHSFIPFQDQEGEYSFAQTDKDFADAGLTKDVFELALRQQEQERGTK